MKCSNKSCSIIISLDNCCIYFDSLIQLLGYKHFSRYIPLCSAVNYDRISFLGELSLYNVVFSKANLEMTCANVFIIVMLLLFFFVAIFILGMAEETNAVRWMISLEGRVICECRVFIFDCTCNTVCCVLRLQPAVSRGGFLHIGVSSKV